MRLGLTLLCLLWIGCSAKKDTFLNAQDGRLDFTLPNQTLTALYPLPDLNTSTTIDFVNRPRPQPSFIDIAIADYDTEVTRLEARRLVSLRLGYNTRQESSLLIEPYQPQDLEAIEQVLSGLGFEPQEAPHYVADDRTMFLYFYPSALLLSLVTPQTNQENFALLEQIRQTLQAL